MIFRPELARAVLEGRKTVTRRLVSDNPASPWWKGGCSFEPGSVCAVQSGRGKPAIGRIRVLDVRMEMLGNMTDDAEARLEGFDSLADFWSAWLEIHGELANGWDSVWRLEFELA